MKFRLAVTVTIVALLGGCSVGGGTSGSPVDPSPPVDPDPPVDPSPPVGPAPPVEPPLSDVRRPGTGERLEPSNPSSPASWNTSEYRYEGWVDSVTGLPVGSRHPLIRASEGYAARVSGNPGGGSITVAVLDDGVDFNHPELDGREWAFEDAQLSREHGTAVAGVVAARRDGVGMHGVAYNANLVSIGTCKLGGGCFGHAAVVLDEDETAADIALAAGLIRTYGNIVSSPEASSHIINMSFTYPNIPNIDQITSAMQDAAGAGRIMVAALGNCGVGGSGCDANDGLGPLGAPAANMADPGIAGFGIAAGSVDKEGAGRAAHSNTCGSVSEYCLFAPGESVPTTAVGGGYRSPDGTSFAAPYVAGAAAVVWGAFPNKPGDEIVARLLSTADKSGEFGDAAIYGQGKLDLGAAMNPVGSTSLSVEGAGMVPVAASVVDLPPGFDAKSAAAALSDVVVYDEQMFPFVQDLSSAFRSNRGASANGVLGDFLSSLGRSSRVSLPGAKAAVEFATPDRPAGWTADLWDRPEEVQDYRLQLRPTPDLAIAFGRRLDVVGSSNRIVAKRVRRTMFRNDVGTFAALAGAGFALGADWQVDDATTLDFVGRDGAGRLGRSRALLASLGVTHRVGGGLVLGARYGALREDGSLTGIRPAGAFGGVSDVSTRFVDVSVEGRVSETLTLFGGASLGRTEKSSPEGNSLISEWTGSRAESFAVGGEIEGLWLSSDRTIVTASSPFRARDAMVRVEVPVEEIADGIVRREVRSIDLAPSGREGRLQFVYDTGDRRGASLTLGGYARVQPGHDASADPEFGIGAKMNVGF